MLYKKIGNIKMFLTPIKVSAPDDNFLLDANNNAYVAGAVLLDASSYLWYTGSGGDGINITRTSPTPVLCDRKYARVTSFGFLDAFSYAWAWGSGIYTGQQTVGTYYQPQSVLGGIQWRTLICGGGTSGYPIAGLDGSSYAWVWGSTGAAVGDNTNQTRSSPVSVVGGRQFIQITSGSEHVVGLDSSSYAWAWGQGAGEYTGVLGDGTWEVRSSPVSVLGAKQYISVQASQYSNYALDGSSYLWAWGQNGGQLGDNSNPCRLSPVSINGPWDNLYVCNNTVFGKVNSQWYVWGANNGNYGNGTTAANSQPTAVNYPFTIKKIVGGVTIMAFDTSNNLWVWGSSSGSNANLGVGDTSARSFPTRMLSRPSYGLYTPPTSFIMLMNNQRSASGDGVSIFLDQSSYAWTWGGASTGLLGNNNSLVNSSSPQSVIGGLQFCKLSISKTKNVAADHCHIIGLDISSFAWAWGENSHGQLGDNTTTYISDQGGNFVPTSFNNISSPISIIGGKQWLKVLAGHYHSLGIDASSYVWSWGDNTYGQLGDGSVILRSSPVSVIGDKQVIDIAIGSTHSVLLDSSSYVWAWGVNTNGQLGVNDILSRSSPTSVVGGIQLIKITSNCAYMVWGLDSSSYAWGWGNNANGALGNNAIIASSSPVSVVGGKQFTLISGSPLSCVALDASSYAWTWGSNSNGQLGNFLSAASSSPVSVVGNYQWGNIDIGTCLIGSTSYPNSTIAVCGIDTDNRFTDYFTSSYSISSPIAVNFAHSYISPTKVVWKNILGK